MASVLQIGGPIYDLDAAFRTIASNVTLTKHDLVNVQSGQLEVADAGEIIAGVVLEAATSSTSAQVNTVPYNRLVMDNDEAGGAFPTTSQGTYFDITGGTGAQVVDTSTQSTAVDGSGTGQLICFNYTAPQPYEDDTSVGIFFVNPEEQQYI